MESFSDKLFTDYNLNKDILKALNKKGFVNPTPIQDKVLSTLDTKSDCIGQAKTGTGKTLAFALPTINDVVANKKTQSIVICPTRELAKQIQVEYQQLLEFTDIKTTCVFGGEERYIQRKLLEKRPEIVIGTPGRIIDFIKSKKINLHDIKSVILDEADEMFNMGFRESIEEILSHCPEDRQTLLFSATMPKEIKQLATEYLDSPINIKVESKILTVDNIDQSYYVVNYEDKGNVLARLIDFYLFKQCIVFTNTKRDVDQLVLHLQKLNYQVEGLHGDLKQQQRDRVMKSFKDGSVKILVASDVASRGIDVSNIDCVFNFDLPYENELYVHRIGRTGRAGRKGISISFVTPREQKRLQQIEKHINVKLEKQTIPSVRSVKRQAFLNLLEASKDNTEINDVAEKLAVRLIEENENKDDIIMSLCNMLVSSNVREYENVNKVDFNAPRSRSKSGSGRDSKDGRNEDRGPRTFKPKRDEVAVKLNVKKQRGVTPKTLVDQLHSFTSIPKSSFGDILFDGDSTIICVKSKFYTKLNTKLSNKSLFNKPVKITKM